VWRFGVFWVKWGDGGLMQTVWGWLEMGWYGGGPGGDMVGGGRGGNNGGRGLFGDYVENNGDEVSVRGRGVVEE